ncbi:TolC family protein [Rhodohalobacter barkolensis]|nr:TolC family protein [Rhodohalobacter barkolensis]
MKVKNHILPLLFFCFYAFPTLAQQPDSLHQLKLQSVQVAIEFALENNPDLDVYNLNYQKARKEVSISKSSRYPTVSGTFTGQYNRDLPTSVLPGEIFGQPGQTIETQFGQEYNFNTGVTISKNILDWQSRMKTKIAEAQVMITEAETDLYRQHLSEQVAFYYYTAIITQKAIQISEKDRSIADSLLFLTRQNFEKGMVDRSALNHAKINVNNIAQSISESTSMYDQAVSSLKILLGLEANADIHFEDQAAITSAVLPDSPQIEADKELDLFIQQTDQTLVNVRLQKTAYLPKLSLTSYWGQQQFRDDFGLSFSDSDWNPYSYIGFSLSVPIFNGFAKRNQVNVAKIERSIAQQNLQQVQIQSEIQDQLLLSNYRNSLSQVESAYDTYQLWDQNRTLALQKYEKGLISLADYFKTFEDYLKAENNYLNTLSSMYSYYSTIISRQ